MDSAKQKIKKTVKNYIIANADEYYVLLEWIRQRRLRIEDGAEFTEGSDMMPMFELPEDLAMNITLALTSEELTWFKSREGSRWFIKTFPQFSLQ